MSTDDIELDERAWELHQKWTDLVVKCVELDKEIEKMDRRQINRVVEFSFEELNKSKDLNDESHKTHMDADKAAREYFTHREALRSKRDEGLGI